MPQRRDRLFAAGATLLVVTVIGVGFANSGSPRVQRQMAIDNSRVDRLRIIASEIHNRPQLPESLDQIRNAYIKPADPESGTLFEYHPKTPTTYDLCATFAAPSLDWDQQKADRGFWAHPAGRHCFAIDAKADPWRIAY